MAIFLVEGALVNKLMSALLPYELESNLICSESEGNGDPDDVVDKITNPQLFESENDKENSNGIPKLNSNEVHM